MAKKDDWVPPPNLYDRLVGRLSNIESHRMNRTNGRFTRMIVDLQEEFGVRGKKGNKLFRDTVDAAVRAVKTARKTYPEGGPNVAPPIESIPSLPRSPLAPPAVVEHAVIVVIRDPDTGVQTRIPVHVESALPLSPDELAKRALASAINSLRAGRYDAGGAVSADRVTTGTIVTLGVVIR